MSAFFGVSIFSYAVSFHGKGVSLFAARFFGKNNGLYDIIFIPLHAEKTGLRLKLMQIEVLKSKIHRVAVTQADLNYIGSITIDEDLMDAAGLIEGERVYIYNINNGERFDTYVIKGERGSGKICLNGAAARLAQVGDLVIIVSFATMDFEEAKMFRPSVIFPKDNKLI